MSKVKMVRYHFRLSEEDNAIFEKNFQISGCKSKAQFIRSLIRYRKVISIFDDIKLNEIRRIVGALGKNNGLLKILICETEHEYARKKIDYVIRDNEYLKKEIIEVVEKIKKR